MGQYHLVVNLDKKQYITPHALGCGPKLWEQLANTPSTGTALVVLLASASNGMGGGDLKEDPIVGSWRGDRIAFVGDYDDDTFYEVGPRYQMSMSSGVSVRQSETMSGADIYGTPEGWTDVSEAVCAVIERELDGKFEGSGWREFKHNPEVIRGGNDAKV